MTPITSPSSSFSSLAIFIILSSVAACGGAEAGAPANKSPSAPEPNAQTREESEPKTVEEAQDQIARMRASLEGSDVKKSATTPDERPSSSSPISPKAEPAPQGGTSTRELDACGNPCRALVSMKHAVDALCRMTNDSDNRCVDARKTLTDSTTRVSPCKCSL